MRAIFRQFALWGPLALSGAALGQHLTQLTNMTPEVSLAGPATLQPAGLRPIVFHPAPIQPVAQPCITTAEPFDIDDYSGPMNKVIARISQKVEKSTVHVPKKHSSLRPCAMDAGDKFRAFVSDVSDPLGFAGATWDAATAQLAGDDRGFGQGATGYGKRYSATVMDNTQGSFFRTFLYPSLFRQDPRYFRLGQGATSQRLGHALAHRFVTQSDSGKRMFNYSEWLGTVSSKALSNLYHPGNARGFGPTAGRVGFSVANDMAWDVLREFWPEVAHKFKLPFRARNEAAARPAKPTPRNPEPLVMSALDAPVLEPAR
ncbi:MAG TPA: hypothetical protein VF532_09650 [Candidatus Angelobacter sp.]